MSPVPCCILLVQITIPGDATWMSSSVNMALSTLWSASIATTLLYMRYHVRRVLSSGEVPFLFGHSRAGRVCTSLCVVVSRVHNHLRHEQYSQFHAALHPGSKCRHVYRYFACLNDSLVSCPIRSLSPPRWPFSYGQRRDVDGHHIK